jgi:hypothetical protein
MLKKLAFRAVSGSQRQPLLAALSGPGARQLQELARRRRAAGWHACPGCNSTNVHAPVCEELDEGRKRQSYSYSERQASIGGVGLHARRRSPYSEAWHWSPAPDPRCRRSDLVPCALLVVRRLPSATEKKG